jgi:hypothetical protein
MATEVELLKQYKSTFGDVLVTGTEGDELVKDGKVFSVRKILTIPAGTSNLWFDCTALSLGVGIPIVRPPQFVGIAAASIIITMYAGATYTAATGTDYTGVNRNQLSSVTPLSVVNYNATQLTPGTAADVQWLLPTNAVAPVQATSAMTASQLPFIINPANIIKLEINNTDTVAATLEFNFTWNEVLF